MIGARVLLRDIHRHHRIRVLPLDDSGRWQFNAHLCAYHPKSLPGIASWIARGQPPPPILAQGRALHGPFLAFGCVLIGIARRVPLLNTHPNRGDLRPINSPRRAHGQIIAAAGLAGPFKLHPVEVEIHPGNRRVVIGLRQLAAVDFTQVGKTIVHNQKPAFNPLNSCFLQGLGKLDQIICV